MGQLEIEEKLRSELSKKIKNELQVIYILSRIRKILEIRKVKSKYQILNFYCNWSLHSKISKTDGNNVNKLLKEFIENPKTRYKLNLHIQFFEELSKFLQDYSLPNLSKDQSNSFNFILGQILSDTPVEVIVGTKYKITFSKPNNLDESGVHRIIVEP